MKRREGRLTAAAVVAALGTASAAWAQQEPTAERTSGELEEVVVTAQRTESLLSDTPLAVTALTGDELRDSGVTNTTQLADHIPNLSIDNSNDFFITIRGVTSNDATEKGDPSAAFMLDGVYIARPQAQDVSFYDIARVEVLRGPQGTLWGRNTTAGLVHVIANRPVHHFEAGLNGSFGNFGTQQADGMINLPVSDTVAVRGAVSYDKRDSYIIQRGPNAFSDDPWRDNLSGRLQALFDFSDRISLILRGDYSLMKGSEGSAGQVALSNVYDMSDPQNPVRRRGASNDLLRTRDYALGGSPAIDNNTWAIAAELNWEMGPAATLTYLGSYRELERDEGFPLNIGLGGSDAIFFGDYWQNSQELRLAIGGDGPLKAQAGVYYFKEESGIALWLFDLIPGVLPPVFGFPQDPTIAESYAGFGQATYSVTPALRLTAGIRYSHDDKSRIGATAFNGTPRDITPPFDVTNSNSAARSFSETTWRAGVDLDVNEDTLLYGSVATGYKAGGFGDGCIAGTVDPNGLACNQVVAVDDLYYDPENLTAYEIGLKTEIGGRFRLNGAAFYYDYRDLQVSGIGTVGGAPSTVTKNAAKAKVKGLELEGLFRPSQAHQLDGSLTWLDATYDEYQAGGLVDWSGRSLDRSPEMVVALGYTYTHALAAGGSLAANVRSRYSDSYVVSAFSVPAQYEQPSFTKTDVSLTYRAPDDRWYLQAFGRNLEDEVELSVVNALGFMWSSQPRTFGVGGGLRF